MNQDAALIDGDGTTPVRTSRVIEVEHVTIHSPRAFADVRARLEATVPPSDPAIHELIARGDVEALRRRLEESPTLSILNMRDHGGLLALDGDRRNAIQYDIGNQLTASKMTRHRVEAALYPPIRVLLSEDEVGHVTFEYDQPVSISAQFGDTDINRIATKLDEDLEVVLEAAAGRNFATGSVTTP